MPVSKSILDAFGSRWNPNHHEGEIISENVRRLVSDLDRAEALLRVLTAKLESQAEPQAPTPAQPPPHRESVRSSDLPAALAKSPAISELHRAADGGIVWPAHPGRPLLATIMARLQGVDCEDKVCFARKLGTVIAARRRLKIWPCRDGQPLDGMGVFFNDKVWSALSTAAAQVRQEVSL